MKLNFSKTKLKNGIRIITSPMKETEAVSVQVLFGVGSRYEDANERGVAHFLEHMAFKGTKRRPTAMDISKEIDGVGGNSNASTSQECTKYYIYLPADKLEMAMDILSDILLNSTYEAKEMTKEKGAILEEIKMLHDDPDHYTYAKFFELLFGDTPLGREIAGTTETVKKLSRKNILDFYDRFYNPDNMVVSICGNISEKKTKEMAEKMFGKLRGKTRTTFETNVVAQTIPRVKVLPKDTEQARMYLGFRSFGRKESVEKRYARSLMGDILGGYMSSQLFSQLRERRGLAYHVWSDSASYHDTGQFTIGGGFNTAKLNEATREIFKILLAAKKKGFSPEEIKMAKENNIGNLKLALENSNYIAGSLGSQELLRGSIETPDEIIANIRKVSNNELMEIAEEIFQPHNLNLLVSGPLDKESEESALSKLIKL